MKLRAVGVEEELLLVDRAGHQAAPVGEQVLAAAAARHQPLEHEFKQEQVEIGSSPQTDPQLLRDDLVGLRAAVAATARDRGAEIAALATSPWKASPRSTPDERYERMVSEFGLLAAEQLTCGQHVHVDIGSRVEGVAVLNRIRGWLPVLTALSANSPFWQGQDTGYASFRTVLWGRWPSAGPTPLYADVAEYDETVAQLIASGAALDDGMIYFDARLSAHYPTLEIRVADVCSDVRDAVLLAVLARALVQAAFADWVTGNPPLQVSTALLRGASWRAARWGMSGDLVDPRTGRGMPAFELADELAELVGPALRRSGDDELVAAGLARLRAEGTGAQRQRASFARRGSLDDVVADAAQRTVTP